MDVANQSQSHRLGPGADAEQHRAPLSAGSDSSDNESEYSGPLSGTWNPERRLREGHGSGPAESGGTQVAPALPPSLTEPAPRKRAVRACDPCRKKRAKCSGDCPCTLCVTKPELCIYAPFTPKIKKRHLPSSGTPALAESGLRLKRRLPEHALGMVTNMDPETVIQEVPVPPQTQVPQSMMSQAVSSQAQGRQELTCSRRHLQQPDRYTHEPPVADELSSMEARLTHVERVLNRLAPNCLTDESVSSLHQQRVSLTDPPPAVQAQSSKPATDVSEPNSTGIDRRSSDSTSFKTGGFLINNEETALTFWGSTSALGGRNNKAHLYRSIPRFVNGVLLVHVPASSNSVDKKQYRTWVDPTPKPAPFVDCSPATTTMNDTPTGAVEESPAPQPPTPMKIASTTANARKFSQIIPLEMELLDHILANYWEQFHPQFPLIDKLWFNEQLALVRSLSLINIDEHWRFILVFKAIVTLMLNFTPSLTHWKKSTSNSLEIQGATSKGVIVSDTSNFTDHDITLKHLIDSYKQILFDHYEFPDIYMVQSLLIVVLTGGCGRGARATGVYGYMGMAVRMSHELGLHRSIRELGVKHRRLNREALALRNRTWHCVMILETYTGIWTGRPLAIHDNDWDAEYPEVTNPDVETLVHHIELAQIIARILRFANRARPLNTEEFVANITASLKTWWTSLDEDWRALKFSERWNSKALMALMYNAAVILFHRMAFHRIDQPACLESAAAITKLVSRFEKPPSDNECVALFPTFTYAAMLACSIHIDQMLAYGGEGMGESVHRLVSAIGCLEKCMRVFDTLRSVFVDAERCWKTVLDFLSMKGIRLDELVNAAKSGSAIAAAVSGMGALARGSPGGPQDVDGVDINRASGTLVASRPVVSLSAPTEEVHPTIGGESTSIANWPTGFLHEALLRNELLKTNNSLPSHFNALSHHLRLGSTDSLSASPTANMGILNGGDSGFIWDGLSLFDLAGLGGIGMGQPPNLQQFNLQQGALAQQQSLSHQQYQQLLPQQQLSRSTPQAPIFPSSNLLQPRPLQMQPVQQQFLRTAQPQADTNFPNAYTQQKPTQRQLQPPLQLQRHPVPNQPQLLFTPGSQIKSELLGFSNDALNGSIAGNTMNTLGQVSTCDYVPPPSFGAGTGAFIRQ